MKQNEKPKKKRKMPIKQVDLVDFANAFMEWQAGRINSFEVCAKLGITRPTLRKNLNTYLEQLNNAILKGEIVCEIPPQKK